MTERTEQNYYDDKKASDGGETTFVSLPNLKYRGNYTLKDFTMRIITPMDGIQVKHFHILKNVGRYGTRVMCLNSKDGILNVREEACPICVKLREEIISSDSKTRYQDAQETLNTTTPIDYYVVQVYDVTPCKTVTYEKYGKTHIVDVYRDQHGSYPTELFATKQSIIEVPVAPSNKEKLLTMSGQLFNLLHMTDLKLKQETGTHGLDKQFVNLLATGTDKDTAYTFQPSMKADPVDAEVADLSKVSGEHYYFNSDELNLLMSGVSLADVYDQRTAKREAQQATASSTNTDGQAEALDGLTEVLDSGIEMFNIADDDDFSDFLDENED